MRCERRLLHRGRAASRTFCPSDSYTQCRKHGSIHVRWSLPPLTCRCPRFRAEAIWLPPWRSRCPWFCAWCCLARSRGRPRLRCGFLTPTLLTQREKSAGSEAAIRDGPLLAHNTTQVPPQRIRFAQPKSPTNPSTEAVCVPGDKYSGLLWKRRAHWVSRFCQKIMQIVFRSALSIYLLPGSALACTTNPMVAIRPSKS